MIGVNDIIFDNNRIAIKGDQTIGRYAGFEHDRNTNRVEIVGVDFWIGLKHYTVETHPRLKTTDAVRRLIVTKWNQLKEFGLPPSDEFALRDYMMHFNHRRAGINDVPFTGINLAKYGYGY